MTESNTPRSSPSSEPADNAPASRKSGALRIVLRVVLFSIVALLAVAAAGRHWLWRWAERPFGAEQTVQLTIKPKTPLRGAARQLEQQKLISDERAFVIYLMLTGRRNALQAGEFAIATPITPERLIQSLRRGSFQQRLTIPEGWTAAKIGRALIDGGWIASEGEWMDIVAEPIGADLMGEEMPFGAEGFCFPDTYLFEKGTKPAAIRDRMVKQFARMWASVRPEERDPRSADLSMREVVTLASMIQRESRGTEEMPQIASVYLNRLKKRMKLQCCATIHYALGEVWDRALTYKDLEIDSPYNTYVNAGLPPGPIGNPGREAIEAVLRPADEPYLFYVYRGDGTHEFTKTYSEHMRAARKFRKSDPAAELVKESK